MNDTESADRIVLLFDPQARAIEHEFSFDDFEAARSGHGAFAGSSGTAMPAAFASVVPGFGLEGLVFFLLPLDGAGGVAAAFDLPFDYLSEMAGVRPEFGIGPVRVASRTQCPVPWLALRLWEPDTSPDGPVRQVQQRLARNRRQQLARTRSQPPQSRSVTPMTRLPRALEVADLPVAPSLTLRPTDIDFRERAASGDYLESIEIPIAVIGAPASSMLSPAIAGAALAQHAYVEPAFVPVAAPPPLAESFPAEDLGPTPRPQGYSLPESRVSFDPRQRYVPPALAEDVPRDASGGIEPSYLEQMRRFRAEILELKAALRLERERNRRLQALLRGQI